MPTDDNDDNLPIEAERGAPPANDESPVNEAPPTAGILDASEESPDDIPDWLTEPDETDQHAPLGPYQFSLLGLAGLTTACGVYVVLEKWHGGRFGMGMLLAMAVVAAIGLPVIWMMMWVARSLVEGSGLSMFLWLAAAVAAAMFGLGWLAGF
ncbi:MAG: hypothetical protein AB7O59_06990 [Pirellulales bacterium]